jgi:hypothetical protein
VPGANRQSSSKESFLNTPLLAAEGFIIQIDSDSGSKSHLVSIDYSVLPDLTGEFA